MTCTQMVYHNILTTGTLESQVMPNHDGVLGFYKISQ